MNAHLQTVAIEVEGGVLGTLLLDGAAFDRITVPLAAEHFAREDHRRIFGAIQALLADGKPADVITVAEHLEAQGLAEACGGLAYLAELANGMWSAAGIGRYAELLVERAQLRALLAATAEIHDLATAHGLTVAEKLQQAQARMQAVAEGAATGKPTPQRIADAAMRHLQRLDARQAGEIQCLPTGFADLDRLLNGGMRDGQLILVAARPGMGKTSLALQIAGHVAEGGNPALFCSQEMGEGDLMDRIHAARARIHLGNLVAGRLERDEYERLSASLGALRDQPLFLDEQPALTLADVAVKARSVRRTAGLRLLVIDYIQLMTGTGDNRNAEIERISRGLKQLAKELSIPVVALSQLSRECEKRPNKRPQASDLRDSGSLEQDADVIAFVYRDEAYNPDSPDKGTAEILLRKNRQGSTGDVRLGWRGEFAAFSNLDMAAWAEQRRQAAEQRALEQPMNRRRRGFDA